MKKKEKFDYEKLYTYLLSQSVIALVLVCALLVVKFAFPKTYSGVSEFYVKNFQDKTSAGEVLNDDSSTAAEQQGSASSDGVVKKDDKDEERQYSSIDLVGESDLSSSQVSGAVTAPVVMVQSPEDRSETSAAVSPVKGRITSYFSSRTHPLSGSDSFHYGVDIGADNGDPIFAVLDGTVCVSKYDSTYGYYVVIEHSNGVKTLYAHCSKLLVERGEKVTKGQNIARVGSTGNSTGPHLHFELLVNGVRIDPMTVFKNLGC